MEIAGKEKKYYRQQAGYLLLTSQHLKSSKSRIVSC